MFYILYFVINFTFPIIFSNWKNQSTKLKARSTTAVVSFISASITTFISLYLIFNESQIILQNNLILGQTNEANLFFSYISGFFLWDTVNMTLSGRFNITYFTHHLIGFLIYFICVQQPYLQYHSIRFLLFEISTIFLNIKIIFENLDLSKKYNFLSILNQILFLISFILVRLVFGVYNTLDGIMVFYKSWSLLESVTHPYSAIFLFCSNLTMTLMNFYWGKLLIETAIKIGKEKMNKTKTKKKNKKV